MAVALIRFKSRRSEGAARARVLKPRRGTNSSAAKVIYRSRVKISAQIAAARYRPVIVSRDSVETLILN